MLCTATSQRCYSIGSSYRCYYVKGYAPYVLPKLVGQDIFRPALMPLMSAAKTGSAERGSITHGPCSAQGGKMMKQVEIQKYRITAKDSVFWSQTSAGKQEIQTNRCSSNGGSTQLPTCDGPLIASSGFPEGSSISLPSGNCL